MNLNNFFNPKSIAVIGASSDLKKVGFALMSNLTKSGERKIFPVSISEKEILGIKTTNSILEITDSIDLAIIAVKSDFVPQILSDCGNKGIKSVIVISAGFKEIGESGLALERKINEIAKEKGINLLGPNCLGTISTHDDFNSSFAAGSPPIGSVAFLSQSGALGTSLIDMAITENVGFSKFISLGNEASMNEMDFLELLADDPNTKAILIYVEKLSDGPLFMKFASEITKVKPIVILKAGRSAMGAKAVSSHTGSLAPDDLVFTSACKQSGIITVNSIREFFNMAKLFQMGITKPLEKIIVLTNGGGPSVVTTDLIDTSSSLSLYTVPESTKEELRKILPPMASVQNPVDIIGDALSDRFEKSFEILVKEKDADAIVLLVTPQMMTEMQKTAELVKKYSTQMPIIPVFLGGPQIEPAREALKEGRMVNFMFPSDAVSALNSLSLRSKKSAGFEVLNIKSKEVGGEMMNFPSMVSLFSEYDMPISGVFLKDKFEIVPLLKKLRYENFVIKAISPDIVHKTDYGAIVMNLKNEDEALKAWDGIIARNPKARIEGIHILPMAIGREVIIGMKRDATFGPTILFGTGGILAEAINDTAIRVAPVEKDEALKMIQEIKGIEILRGIRGQKSVDFDALADIIVNMSRLAIENPEVKEIDINPVILTETETTIVDARVMV